MSIASPFASEPVSDRQDDAASLRRTATRSLEAAGFWTAVVAPLTYPALLYGGLQGQYFVLAAVITANVFGLVLGRDYNRE